MQNNSATMIATGMCFVTDYETGPFEAYGKIDFKVTLQVTGVVTEFEQPVGSPFNWLGYPLTGVSFASSVATVAGNVMQTVATNPASSIKRMFVESYLSNLGGATTYSVYKSDGTHNMQLVANLAVVAGAANGASTPLLLEPGESLVMQCPGSLLMSIGVMSFDLSCPLKSVSGWGPLPAGVTPIYTVPPNTTAFMMRIGAPAGLSDASPRYIR